MKKFIWICASVCMMLLSGCSSSYERDTQAGKIVTLSVTDMEKKRKNKENFVVVFAQSWCTHCKAFNAMLQEYLPNHHVIVHEVVLDKDSDLSREKAIEVVQSYFPDMTGTPSIYYVEDGEIKSKMDTSGENGLSEESFDQWIVKYHIDEKQ